MNIIAESSIIEFEHSLRCSEKSKATIQKYDAALREFQPSPDGSKLTKDRLLRYREQLAQTRTAQIVNGVLTAINAYFRYNEMASVKVRFLEVQRQAFLNERRELNEAEYKRLLTAARWYGNERLCLVMMTICGIGIRVSELQYITVEAVKSGRADICMKGKCRTILLSRELRKKLSIYARYCGIDRSCIFRTRSGKPLDRTNIGHNMKKLCHEAKVDRRKIFPP